MKKNNRWAIFSYRYLAVNFLLGNLVFNAVYVGMPELTAGIPLGLAMAATAFSLVMTVWLWRQGQRLQAEAQGDGAEAVGPGLLP